LGEVNLKKNGKRKYDALKGSEGDTRPPAAFSHKYAGKHSKSAPESICIGDSIAHYFTTGWVAGVVTKQWGSSWGVKYRDDESGRSQTWTHELNLEDYGPDQEKGGLWVLA
jgi:hypothetical protein